MNAQQFLSTVKSNQLWVSTTLPDEALWVCDLPLRPNTIERVTKDGQLSEGSPAYAYAGDLTLIGMVDPTDPITSIKKLLEQQSSN